MLEKGFVWLAVLVGRAPPFFFALTSVPERFLPSQRKMLALGGIM
jgi:hypothetical protein